MNRPCERCATTEALEYERFCKACRKVVLQELQDAGALTPHPYHGDRMRSDEQRENTRETKHGRDG